MIFKPFPGNNYWERDESNNYFLSDIDYPSNTSIHVRAVRGLDDGTTIELIHIMFTTGMPIKNIVRSRLKEILQDIQPDVASEIATYYIGPNGGGLTWGEYLRNYIANNLVVPGVKLTFT